MQTIWQQIKGLIDNSSSNEAAIVTPGPPDNNKDMLRALGFLFWVIAKSDQTIDPKEEQQIKLLLAEKIDLSNDVIEDIFNNLSQTERKSIDLYQFTRQINDNFSREQKIALLENLFRVACCDKNLSESEIETIRKISQLLHLEHIEFINAKIRIKKEFGLDTINF
jgi:uncharacterized tellurite resistance protein B-like protein